MINFSKNSIPVVILLFLLTKFGVAQCPAPGINAQAGTGPSTTICSGQCASLTATVAPPPNSTTTYSFTSVTYSTFPYFGGSNAFNTSSDDLWSDSINIGFNFCYFGQSHNKLLVGSNGEITFDLTRANQPESWVCTQILPNTIEHPGNTICGAYRDYDPFPGGVVRTYTTGTAPCRVFVAYWSSVTLFSCANPVSSFQICLYESTNEIAVNIQNSTACMSWNNGRGLLGIQNAAATVAYGPATRNTLTAWTAINESWRFVPTAAPVYNVNWTGPGGFTAAGLTATPCPASSGNYTATMTYCGGTKTSTVQVNVATPTVTASASSNTVCAPGSVTLTGSGATSYTWQPGGMTGATVAVSPTMNTTYTLFGTSATCTGSTTISITVGTPPTINAFNLSGTICPGGTANAVATGALSYTWNPGGIVGNIVALTPTVTTTYTVLGSSGGCAGQTTVVIPVGSSPTITAVSSPTSICPGANATLTAVGATNYTWNPGAMTGSAVVVSPGVTTTYTVTGTNTLICPGTQTVTLVVNPTPTLTATSNPTAICVGGSATLTSTGATTYTWMPGSLSGGTVVVSPTITTIYTVTGSNGSCASTKTVQLVVNPNPTVTASASSSTVCAGTSLTLTAGGATSYTWMPGSLTGSAVAVTPATSTIYTVTGSNGTCSGTQTISITVNPTPTLTAAANPTSICFGSGATVTLTSTGAATCTWMPGSLTGGTVTVTPTVTTTYTVSGTSALSCTGTKTVTLVVNPQPTLAAVSNPTAICAGGSATLTSTGATSYTWMPGSITGSAAVVSPTVTTIYTVTGSNGSCTNTQTVSLTVNPSPTVTSSASSPTVCAGTSLTLTAGGATTYTWMPGSLPGGTVTVTPTVTTTYTVTGSNGSCSSISTITITVNPTPTLTATANPTAVCSGAGTTVTLTATGATTYTWMPGSLPGGTVSVTPTITTTYTVSGASAAGCTGTNTVTVTVNTTPTVTAASSSPTVCAGSTVTLTSTGATTYTWMPGSLIGGTVTASPTITTTYTVTGTNGNCTDTETVTVNVTPGPTLTAVANPTGICSGSSSTLSASGATTYTWMPGSLTGGTVTVSPTVTTTYTVTGNNGTCSSSLTVALTVTTTPTVTAVSNPTAICAGASATLSSGGATTYTWMPGSLSGATVAVTPTSTTIYTVTGANGACTNTNTVSLTVNPLPTVSATANPTVICSGNSSTLTGSGATSYTWMPGSLSGATVAVTPTVTTNYTLTGANASGCTNTAVVSVSVNPTPTLTAVANPTAICVGSSATLTSTGATSYTWNPGSLSGGTVTVSPTVTTVYTVTGSSAGCPATKTVQLIVNPNPTVTAAVSSPSICSGSTATLTSSGAATYTWMPGSLTGGTVTVSPTVTTTYTVTGATAAGCTATNTVTLIVIPGPTLTAAANPTAICSGSSSTLSASGATTYTWMPGSLPGGTVVVTPTTTTQYTVTGNNGICSSTMAVTVSVTPTPTLSVSTTPTAVCAGSNATLSASGATTYTWMPGSLSGGTVVVTPTVTTVYTVTGANGSCTDTKTISITVNPTPTVTATSTPASSMICIGQSATLTAGGATTYTWMPGSMTGGTVVVTPTTTTSYTLTGANASGCTGTTVITITVNPLPIITVTASPSSIICAGQSATLTASGATGTYTWLPGPFIGNPNIVTPATTTNYTVVGMNAFGCPGFSTITVVVVPNPVITVAASADTICAGSTVTLSSTGATNYTWMPGSLTGGTVTATPSITTTYTVTGANGSCTDTETITIVVNPSPTVTASSTPTAICSGSSATLTGGGATSYTWMPGSLTGGTVTVAPSTTTTYTLTGSNGLCSNTATVTVSVTPTPTLTSAASPTGICIGSTATLTSSGAASYTWNPGAITGGTVTVSPTVTTVYTVTGANGSCTNTQTVSVTVSPIPTVGAVANPTAFCAGSSATLTGSGASSYTWMPGSLTGATVVVTPTTNTTYTVTGSNAGCTNTAVVSVTVFSAPVVNAVTSKTAICLGDTATLSATGAISYTWNPGALSGASVVVNPTTTTIYTVIGSNGICSSTATVGITVNTYPVLSTTVTPSPLCAGSTATMMASGATNYTWMPGSLSGSMVTVSPAVSTTYTLTGANGNCTSTNTISLTVNSGPTVTAVASPTLVCAGSPSTLTATGATTYTWMPGSLTGSSVVVTPTATTQYTLTGSNGICTGTSVVTVSVIPGPTITAATSATSICSGQTATLTATGALSYTWMPPALLGGTIVVSPTVSTTYSVTGVNASGCKSTATVSINVNTTPTVTANTSTNVLCSGNSATLTATGATTYTWNPGSLTNGTVVVTPTTTTTYTVIGANGTCTNTKTLNIVVVPSPTLTAAASPTILCAGGTTTLTASGATSYTWMPPAITGSQVVVSPTVITVYTVTGANPAGCSSTQTVLVNVNTPTIVAVSSPTAICIGSSATITASGANTYTWLPGASTGTSIVVNPTVTTTYTVNGTNTFGCTGTSTITLTVTPIPTISIANSSPSICAGGSSTLTGTGATNYTWTPGSMTGSMVVVTPTATTIYTLTGDNGACSSSDTTLIIVNPAPTVTAVSSPTAICSGASSTLTASGAVSYTWMPGTATGNPIAVTPTVTTVYTVSGVDALGCTGTGTVMVNVDTPTITATATPTSICTVGSVTLNASGASTYTWMPGSATGSSVVVTPTITTTYTVNGTSALGCAGSNTVTITVFTNPTVTAVASATTLCSGYSATLTSGGATTYTWAPGALTGATVVVTPTTTTTYTVIGQNGTCPTDTATVTINVIPSPQNVTATNNGPITCLSPSVNLFGATTSTNVVFQWAGPSSYTSSVQNPTGVTVAGVYTLSVIDITNGCITTATTAVLTATAGPPVTLTSTGTITCLSNTVSISVTSTVSPVSYTWTGPGSFTSTAGSFTTSTGGVYTLSAFDPATGCTGTSTVAAITDTYVAVTATILPSTCTGSVTNNDGTILAGNYTATDKYDLVAGATYTGTATYATATVIPVSGTIVNNLANPAVNTPYTIRFFGANGCFKDTTLILVPVDCAVNNALGIAKAVSAVTTNTNGTYDVSYKVVVTNTGFAMLNNVVLTENLSNTFPLPTTFTIVTGPSIVSPISALILDPTYDGSAQPAMTSTPSALSPGVTDTILFTVRILPNGVFSFSNTVLGAATGGTASTVVTDSSQVGLNPDPDNDGDPTNNNIPTPLNITPNLFFGVTKAGELSSQLADGSYDITYTLSIHNLGNDTLRNVKLKDSLMGTTIKSPATYSIKNGPTATGSLVVNTAYDGNLDPNLLIPASSKIAPGTVQTVIFTINVFPDTVTVISNSAWGSAIGSNSVTVRDTSNNGSNPDTNGNGIWNEPVDNVPTVLIIPDQTFFVPEAFTPNGDGKNDFFVIKGITGTENKLTIYNRWGNKVYEMANYDNTWQGMPNVNGTLGNQRLPQGTYYWILEFPSGQMKGNTELKSTNGFVVLQY